MEKLDQGRRISTSETVELADRRRRAGRRRGTDWREVGIGIGVGCVMRAPIGGVNL